MSTGKLKPQYNRVRTSNALQTTSIWANTIGIAQEQGTNAAVEASIYAPSHGGGGRAARMQKAQNLVQASGFQPAVTDLAGLTALARAQGGATNTSRGACKICGGLGHLTKQCRNFAPGGGKEGGEGAAAAAGALALLTENDDLSSLSSGSDDDSDSGSDDSRKKRKRSSSDHDKHSSRKSSKRKREKKEKKHKKHSSSKKAAKESKHRSKRSRRSRSPS